MEKEKMLKLLASVGEAQLMLFLDQLEEVGEVLVKSTETAYDDMALQGLKMFAPELKKLIDKIDGEEG